MVGDPGLHRGRDAKAHMDLAEVVVDEVQRDGRGVHLDLFREAIGQAREAAHVHPHREVLALHKRRGNVARVGKAFHRGPRRAHKLRGGVASAARLAAAGTAVDLIEDRVVHVTERIFDRVQVDAKAVRRDLDSVRNARRNIVHEDVRGVAHPLAELLVPHIQWTFDAIIPVPLHYLRLQKRGYNQANLLAQALSERIRIPVLEDILIRTRATTSQVELSAAERRENVAEAFSINGNVPPRVLLIDDVCTTGSTLTAAAQALQQADVKTIYAATVSLAS